MENLIVRYVLLISSIFLIPGCNTINPPQPWSLQPGAVNVYKYYEGNDLPLEQLAILRIEDPLSILRNDRYYRRTFSIPPGNHVINLSFLEYNKFGVPTTSRQPVSTRLGAEAGHIYKAVYIDFWDLIDHVDESNPDVWHPFILDITDDDAMLRILNESPYPSIREQVIGIATNPDMIESVARRDPERRVRDAAKKRLNELAK